LVLLDRGRVAASGAPETILADVARSAAAGVRPHDVSRVFAALGLPGPPLDVDAAAERLRAAGFVPRPPAMPHPPARGARLIVVERVSHRYGEGRLALDDVSLTLARGERVALVGRNGSGKTTLAKHLNGLLAPSSGRVTVDGDDVARLPLERLAQRVGY